MQVLLSLTHSSAVRCLTFSSDSQLLACGCEDGTISVWDVETGTAKFKCVGHSAAVLCVAFASDAHSIIASGSADKTLRTWEANSGQSKNVVGHHSAAGCKCPPPSATQKSKCKPLPGCQAGGHAGAVSSLVFASDGTRIISGSHDRSLRVWHAATLAEERTLVPPQPGQGELEKPVTSISLSPRSSHVLAGLVGGGTKLIDMQTGNTEVQLRGHKHTVTVVAFAGSVAATCSDDGTLRLWDSKTGKLNATFRGHRRRVTCIAVSPDGKRILSGSSDSDILVWDAAWAMEGTRKSEPLDAAEKLLLRVGGGESQKILR